jgi:hypothetical protein
MPRIGNTNLMQARFLAFWPEVTIIGPIAKFIGASEAAASAIGLL